MFGLLNIYKPVGMTSHDVVSALRRLTKIKQIGHTGTLDPFAEGALPVCIGKATRLIEFLPDDKEYLATVQFGSATTTYDTEGEITFSSDKKVSKEDIINALKNFEGEIEQFPPIYSAIKVNGKKLYDYARQGQEVEIKPRKVTIEEIELKSFNENLQQAQILIKCSKGTYIRSIAHDLGQNLSVGGHLIKLVRTKAGKFRVENSIKLDELDVNTSLINPIEMLELPKLEVEDNDLEKIKNGMPLQVKFEVDTFCVLTKNSQICAIGFSDGDKIKLKKVFL